MTVAVKICGLNNEDAIIAAANAGADYAGFVHFEKSPRHVSLSTAANLIAQLPSTIRSVMVLVNPDDALLSEIANIVKPRFFQLHGDESPGRLREIKRLFPTIGLIKAVSVSNAQEVMISNAFYGSADMMLFDAKALKESTLPGGNGITFDWSILHDADIRLPWFLSGGLTPENVVDAIRATDAKMIDVSSGVERTAGVKDAALIDAFVIAAKQ